MEEFKLTNSYVRLQLLDLDKYDRLNSSTYRIVQHKNVGTNQSRKRRTAKKFINYDENEEFEVDNYTINKVRCKNKRKSKIQRKDIKNSEQINNKECRGEGSPDKKVVVLSRIFGKSIKKKVKVATFRDFSAYFRPVLISPNLKNNNTKFVRLGSHQKKIISENETSKCNVNILPTNTNKCVPSNTNVCIIGFLSGFQFLFTDEYDLEKIFPELYREWCISFSRSSCKFRNMDVLDTYAIDKLKAVGENDDPIVIFSTYLEAVLCLIICADAMEQQYHSASLNLYTEVIALTTSVINKLSDLISNSATQKLFQDHLLVLAFRCNSIISNKVFNIACTTSSVPLLPSKLRPTNSETGHSSSTEIIPSYKSLRDMFRKIEIFHNVTVKRKNYSNDHWNQAEAVSFIYFPLI